MGKGFYRMTWILALLTALLSHRQVSFAQSSVETTPSQVNQRTDDLDYNNDDLNQATPDTVYLHLHMFVVGYLLNTEDGGTGSIYLTNNGTTIWGPVEVSGGDIIDINTVIAVTKSSGVRLKLWEENNNMLLGRARFGYSKLKRIVDKGEQNPLPFKGINRSSLAWQYSLNYEVKSMDDLSEAEMHKMNAGDVDCGDYYSSDNPSPCCGDYYSSDNPYPCCDNGGNCTWWAWYMAQDEWEVNLPSWGDAKNWADKAKSSKPKYQVSSTPAVNTIAVNTNQEATIDGIKSVYGHVAWVEEVNDSTITVSEMNCCATCGFGSKDKEYSKSYFNGGFIYPQSDLTISNLSVNPTSGSAGSKVTVSFTISNTGKGPAGKSTTNIRINQSTSKVQTSDKKLKSVSVSTLSAGSTSTFNQSVTIPSNLSAGTYYIWVIADVNSSAYQKDESNDRAYTSFTIN